MKDVSHFLLAITTVVLLAYSCTAPEDSPTQQPAVETVEPSARFKLLEAARTGIDFANRVTESEEMNPFVFFNIYNGGGVAVGDFDNDGLPDLYFTANQLENKLYRNLGSLQFEDITESAGVKGIDGWTTGVTLVDVNADGWLDIYVCQSGGKGSGDFHNLLFVNNHDLTFTEQAAAYGIDDAARSNHATFFDYDRDGDLDLYVVNHPLGFGDYIAARVEKAKSPGNHETDKLFRNDGNNHFTEVTDAAGVRNYGFGLSVTTADFNNDGWPDLYVANDYSEPDCHYQNNGDGTFTDVVQTTMSHTSQFAMGSDAGDINNDGLMDLVVVDMMAEDNRRKKTNMQGMDRQAFYQNFALGRHYQYMQNALQLNRGNGHFSEIAELAGVSTTDWSWAPLFCDFDNDGLKDLFITNGMRRDIRSNDFVKKLQKLESEYITSNFQQLLNEVPVEKIDNHVYRNTGELTFEKMNAAWGISYAGFTNGAAYADLDADGDLDLVLNNLEDHASLFENLGFDSHYVKVQLKGPPNNPFGIGAKVEVSAGEVSQTAELVLSRGFLSSVEPVLHIGLGMNNKIDRVVVTWHDGKQTIASAIAADQTIVVAYADAADATPAIAHLPALLEDRTTGSGVRFQHTEIFYEDYDSEVLLPHRYSQLGPFVSTGDVNNDGREDFFVGGAAGQVGVLYLQTQGGAFQQLAGHAWKQHAAFEDMGSAFFDADGDGDLDLYVASGSNQWTANTSHYQDRLYLNDGSGRFSDATDRLPAITLSSSCVRAADADGDGDLDLFVGGRLIPGKYPHPASSLLLINDNGHFTDRAADLAPELHNLGLVADAQWADIDNDSDQDLVVAGEWMPITIFENQAGVFRNITGAAGLADKIGWWYSLTVADFDGDGDLDLMAGNLGLNSKYQTREGPVEVFSGDLDKNGSNDIVLAYNQAGTVFPVRGKTCSSEQMPVLNQKMPNYELFGNASVYDIYGAELRSALHKQANWMATSYIENLGNGRFDMHVLPVEAQFSATNAIIPVDVNHDGHLDVILGGNMWAAEVETARHDASTGEILLGDGKGHFTPVPAAQSGYFGTADVKHIAPISLPDGSKGLLVAANNGALRLYRVVR